MLCSSGMQNSREKTGGFKTSDRSLIRAAGQNYKRGQTFWLCKVHCRAACNRLHSMHQQTQQAVGQCALDESAANAALLRPSSEVAGSRKSSHAAMPAPNPRKGMRFDRLIAHGSHKEVLTMLHSMATSKRQAMRSISQQSATKQRM